MPDELIPDPEVAKEFHVSLMTVWRWDRSPARIEAGWPPRIKIGGRNYRHRSQIEAFKSNLLQLALAERDGGGEAA
jgi:predicted DNA-binding transcriptional regulator AlpA